MSQLLNWRIAHICNRLLSVVGLVCVVAMTVLSQNVETIKTEQPVICDAKEYQVRLVSATTTLGIRKANALAIVLTPSDASESRVFGIYWVDAKTPSPTHRDDTTGTLTKNLLRYGNGLSQSNEPVVNNFFSTLKCSSSDAQVSGIQKAMATQSLLDHLQRSSVITLENLSQQLSSYGVAVDPGQIQQASTGNLDLFRNLSNDTEFAKAIRQHVSNLLAAQGRPDQVGYKPTAEEEVAMLVAKNKDLEEKIRKFDEEKSAFLGAAPGGLVVAFPFMSALSVAGLALVGIGVYVVVRWRRSRKKSDAIAANQALRRLQNQIDQPLSFDHVLTSARERQQTIEKKYPPVSQNKKGKARDVSWRRAEEWAQAYADLQNDLEVLSRNASPVTKPESPASSESPATGQSSTTDPELVRKLDSLITTVDGMKNSVEQVWLNVEQRFEGQRALLDIWNRLYEGRSRPFPKQLPDSFTKEVSDVIQLYRLMSAHYGRGGTSVAETMSMAEQVTNDLRAIGNNYLAGSLEPNARIEQIVAVMSRSIKEHSTAQQTLGKHFPGRNLLQIVHAVTSSYEAILRDTDQLMPQQSNLAEERVSSLVREYRRVKPKADRAEELEQKSRNLQTQLDAATSELVAGKTLVDEILLQLNFKTDALNPPDNDRITATLNRLKIERSSSPYLQLRMGLSSALLAMEKTVSTNGSAQDAAVTDALFLNKVMQALRDALARMEECSGDQLWTNVLYEGFNQQWLHYLIRADLLLRTYYSTSAELSLLRKAVSVACNSILAALHDYHVEIREVELFEKLPPNMDIEPVYPGLRNLPAVIDKVGRMVQNIKVPEVVVDVTSFPVFVKGAHVNRGRVAIANPSAWLQH